ncbi:Clp protease ClpP, partial [Pseudomonas sp. SIMBA_041]
MSKKATPRIYNRAGQQVPVQDKSWYAVHASGEATERVIEVFV